MSQGDSETRGHRLEVVGRYFPFCKGVYQHDLTEAAVVWACASLAFHKDRGWCESNFYAHLDKVYISSREAEERLTESEAKQVLSDAELTINNFSKTNEVFQSSVQQLNSHHKDLLSAISLARKSLKHASPTLLMNLISKSILLGLEVDKCDFGLESNVDNAYQEFGGAIVTLNNQVLAELKEGKLIVRDGVIVNPLTVE